MHTAISSDVCYYRIVRFPQRRRFRGRHGCDCGQRLLRCWPGEAGAGPGGRVPGRVRGPGGRGWRLLHRWPGEAAAGTGRPRPGQGTGTGRQGMGCPVLGRSGSEAAGCSQFQWVCACASVCVRRREGVGRSLKALLLCASVPICWFWDYLAGVFVCLIPRTGAQGG